MEIRYKRTHQESYMIVEKESVVCDYQERMLRENEIRSLLSFYTMQFDGKTQFWHDISGKQSLRDYLGREGISLELLQHILTCLILAFDELQKYLIQQQSVLLQPDTIYVNRQGQLKVFLCFCPSENKRERPLFGEIMEYILENVGGEEALVQLCYQLYELSLQPETTLQQMYNIVENELEKEIEDESYFSSEEEEKVVSLLLEEELGEEEEEDIYNIASLQGIKERICEKGQSLLEMISGWAKPKRLEKKHEDFMIEPQPERNEPTQLLYEGQRECQGQLVYQGSNNEKDFAITKENFRVGHRKEGNDAYLQSDAVSRFHAKIVKQGMAYYIEDMNSTNGTYVNGEQLTYTQRRKLEVMDRIQFADVSYLFL